MQEFSDQNIVIIGGSYGIGEQVVKQALNAGAKVHSLCRNKPSWINDFPSLNHQNFDVSKPELFEGINIPDSIDGIVYCPGSINLKPFGRLTREDFINDWDLSFMGAVQSLQFMYPGLRKSGKASVVLFSTVAVQTGMSYHASVSAAKGALEGLTRSLAAEWASQNIRVNALALSLTDTPLAERLLSSEEKREAAASRHPLKRIGSAEETAKSVLYLLSKDSSWMTGQILKLDGGISSVKPL